MAKIDIGICVYDISGEKDTKAKGYGQRIGAPEKSDRNIQGLTAQQRLHFTLRATRMAETGQT